MFLSDVDWRKWINNTVIPTFDWYSVQTFENIFNTVDKIKETSNWSERFDPFKTMFLYYWLTFKLYRKRSVLRKLVYDAFQLVLIQLK